jgi:hypothetical protein
MWFCLLGCVDILWWHLVKFYILNIQIYLINYPGIKHSKIFTKKYQ